MTELSKQVNDINMTISQTNYQLVSIRKSVSEIETEIKTLTDMNPDKKAEYNKLQELVAGKKDFGKDMAVLKTDRDVLTKLHNC